MAASARASLRRLLRLAGAHDRRPALKALLPLHAPGVELSLDSPGAAPLRQLVAHAARALPLPGPASGAAVVRDVRAMLEINLTRGRVWTAKMRAEEKRSLRGSGTGQQPASPNLAWFFSRLEAAARRAPGGDEAAAARQARQARQRQRHRALLAEARAAAGAPPLPAPPRGVTSAATSDEPLEEPIEILRQMVAVGITPPRRMVVLALTALATSGAPGDFERALAVFWFLELSTPHLACTACVDALVAGCMDASPPPPRGAPPRVWRALSIAEALLGTAGLCPSSHVVNRLLEACNASAEDTAGLARTRTAIHRFAAANVPILEDVSVALLRAAERLNDLPAALAACRQIRTRGGVLSPELLAALWEWAGADGDVDGAAWLHGELSAARAAAAAAATAQQPPPAAAAAAIAISVSNASAAVTTTPPLDE